MTKVRYVEAMYNTAITWDIEDIAERYDFKIEDIANMEKKRQTRSTRNASLYRDENWNKK